MEIPSMGAKRSSANASLPKGVWPKKVKGKIYYYVKKPSGGEKYCGRDLRKALDTWQEYYGRPEVISSISEVMDDYIVNKLGQKKPATQDDYKVCIGNLREVFGEMFMSDLMTRDVADWFDIRSSQAYRRANIELAVFKQIIKWAMRLGVISENPADPVKPNPEKARERYVTTDELWAFLNHVKQNANDPPRTVVMVSAILAAVGGLRRSDIISLTVDKFTEDGLHFKQSKVNSNVHVEWASAMREAYAAAVRLRGQVNKYDLPNLLLNRSGRPYKVSSFDTNWQRCMRSALEDKVISERFRLHDLRAKAGTDGENWWLLGHKDRKVFEEKYRRRARPAKAADLAIDTKALFR